MLENKSILIIGGSAGLGRALAIKLAKKNSTVALMARNKAGLEETARLCEAQPLIISGDISLESDCKTAIDEVIRQHGQLDHLILNAGISMRSKFEDLTDLSILQQVMQTNYFGAVNCTRHALPYLKKTCGMITVISSIQGKIGVPYHTGYAASKHALEGFFNSLRIELNNAIDILMVSPGWIAGTELKARALGFKNDDIIRAKHNKHALTLDMCTQEIIAAMMKRKRELVLPKKYSLLPLLKLFVPSLLDDLIRRKV